MLRRSGFAKVLWLLAVALLPVRIANAHLHMCLDGQNPLVSYHVEDLPTHHGTDAHGDGHSDRDIDASGATATLTKLNKLDDLDDNPVPLLSGGALILLLSAATSEAPQPSLPAFKPASAFDLRPPTRGPPL